MCDIAQEALGKQTNKVLVEHKLSVFLRQVPKNDLLSDNTNDYLVYYDYPNLPLHLTTSLKIGNAPQKYEAWKLTFDK